VCANFSRQLKQYWPISAILSSILPEYIHILSLTEKYNEFVKESPEHENFIVENFLYFAESFVNSLSSYTFFGTAGIIKDNLIESIKQTVEPSLKEQNLLKGKIKNLLDIRVIAPKETHWRLKYLDLSTGQKGIDI